MVEEAYDQGESPVCFVATFFLTLVLIRIVLATVAYVVGLYRFFDVWLYIFLINRVELAFVDDSRHRNSKTSIQEALVSRTFQEGDDGSCPICLGEIGASEIVFHGRHCHHHAFHEECISHWLSIHHSCPYCRQQIITEENKEDALNEILTGVFVFLKLSVYMSRAST